MANKGTLRSRPLGRVVLPCIALQKIILVDVHAACYAPFVPKTRLRSPRTDASSISYTRTLPYTMQDSLAGAARMIPLSKPRGKPPPPPLKILAALIQQYEHLRRDRSHRTVCTNHNVKSGDCSKLILAHHKAFSSIQRDILH